MEIGDILYDTYWSDKEDNLVISEYIYLAPDVLVTKSSYDKLKSNNPIDYGLTISFKESKTISNTIEDSVNKLAIYHEDTYNKVKNRISRVTNQDK
jgi:hypothetical protein